ncbi:hypothetical protein V492_00176 [Pseudogymnoascus sp. VKM F-4246]|nr:hypothetical protein V492_00176 [Pseudogymnoascus sp. VKM F-4246]
MLDNKWSDIHGILRLIRGHPFGELPAFMATFGSLNAKNPKRSKFRRLEKILLACTIIRPDRILDLPMMTVTDVEFELSDKELLASNAWCKKYQDAIKRSRETKRRGDRSAFKYVIKALQQAIHPEIGANIKESGGDEVYGLFNPATTDDEESEDEESEDEESEDEEPEDNEPIEMPEETRDEWIRRVTESGIAAGSSRMQEFLRLFRSLQEEYPNEKIAVVSERTKVPDLVAIILERDGNTCVRYDGRVPYGDRERILRSFQDSADTSHVLLITPGTGGTGLNIPQVSIMIQIELWWNLNVDKQMRGRFHRHGQDKEVKVYRLKSNANVDRIIAKNQEIKGSYNDSIMECLIYYDDDEVVIPPVFEKRELDDEETELYRLSPADLRALNPELAAKRGE